MNGTSISPYPLPTFWARVDFPELGLACVQARVDPSLPVSRLEVAEPVPATVDHRAGLRFLIYPLMDDELTFLKAEALLVDDGRVRLRVARHGYSTLADFNIVPRLGGRCPVNLGADILPSLGLRHHLPSRLEPDLPDDKMLNECELNDVLGAPSL